MADKTLDQFTAASDVPGLFALLFARDEDYSSPDSRSVKLHQLVSAIQTGMVVESVVQSDPTSLSPSKGDVYVVASTGSGGWSGQTNKLAIYTGTGWEFVTASEGWRVYDKNSDRVYRYTGAAWTTLTPDSFDLHITVFGSGTAVTTGNGTEGIAIPATMSGMNVTDVLATVHDKGITGATHVQLRRRRAGADTDVLATLITIGDEFFANDGVINTSADALAAGDILYIDVDVIHSGTAPNGLSVTITAKYP